MPTALRGRKRLAERVGETSTATRYLWIPESSTSEELVEQKEPAQQENEREKGKHDRRVENNVHSPPSSYTRFPLRSHPPNQLLPWLILLQFLPNDVDSPRNVDSPFFKNPVRRVEYRRQCQRCRLKRFERFEQFWVQGFPARLEHDKDFEPIAHLDVPLCCTRKCVDYERKHVR